MNDGFAFHYQILSFFPHDEIFNILKYNSKFFSLFKNAYTLAKFKFEQYFHHPSDKNKLKLSDISSLFCENIFETLVQEMRPQYDWTVIEIVIGMLLCKVIHSNQIKRLHLTIGLDSGNLRFLKSFFTFSKEVTVASWDIKDIETCSGEREFNGMVRIIQRNKSINEISFSFGNNDFGINLLAKKLSISLKKSSLDNFHVYSNIFFDAFQSDIQVLWLNYEIFEIGKCLQNSNQFAIPYLELYLSFKNTDNNQLRALCEYISNSFSTSNLKLTIFHIPNWDHIYTLLQKMKPTHLWVIPYKEQNQQTCDDFFESIASFELNYLNVINLNNFDAKYILNFLQAQQCLVDLRLSGVLSQQCNFAILEFYLQNWESFHLKTLSLNGKIPMDDNFTQLVVQFLHINKSIEIFHIDCDFGGRIDLMTLIAREFAENINLKSFTLRNTSRVAKDQFLHCLKEILKNQNWTVEAILEKVKKYKLI